jgi:nitrate/nitrite transporter NarK
MKNMLIQLADNDPNVTQQGANGTAGANGTVGNSGMTTQGLFGPDGIAGQVINIILYIIGIIAVIMLIVGGIQYATSSGDEKRVTKAKNTIIYALLGLAIAILAWTLVNFVFVNLGQQ